MMENRPENPVGGSKFDKQEHSEKKFGGGDTDQSVNIAHVRSSLTLNAQQDIST